MRKSVHLVGYFYVRHYLLKENSSTKETVNQKHSLAHGTYGSNKRASAITRLRKLDIFTDWATTGYL
jgi:hypothetical protein